jgi:hypothetical protein
MKAALTSLNPVFLAKLCLQNLIMFVKQNLRFCTKVHFLYLLRSYFEINKKRRIFDTPVILIKGKKFSSHGKFSVYR